MGIYKKKKKKSTPKFSLTCHSCDATEGSGSSDHGIESRCNVAGVLLAHAGEQWAGWVSSVSDTHTHSGQCQLKKYMYFRTLENSTDSVSTDWKYAAGTVS